MRKWEYKFKIFLLKKRPSMLLCIFGNAIETTLRKINYTKKLTFLVFVQVLSFLYSDTDYIFSSENTSTG